MDRIYDSNNSFAEGRQTELVILRYLEKGGLVVRATKGNQKHYDLVIIDPLNDKEYIAQIKSSKTKKPYITCHNYQGLLETAQLMYCIPLIVLSFTTKRQFVIMHAVTNYVLYSLHDDPEYDVGNVVHFNCQNKEK